MIKRTCADLLAEYLDLFPVVALVGPRQCGKTTLMKSLPGFRHRYDLEKAADFQQISADPDLFLRLNPRALAVDEAQLLPELFPALRVAVDDNRSECGRFVLTGSSSPDLLQQISETLAGRIGIIEMSPLSYAETTGGKSEFYDLFHPNAKAEEILDSLTAHGDLEKVHDYWFKGGYPEPWVKNSDRFTDVWMDNYTQTYVERDLGKLFPSLNKIRFRHFIDILAGVSGSIINLSEVARSLGVSQPTAREYFTIADGTFLWRTIPSWERDTTKRIVKHPKGYLRDSGLLHFLLRIADLRQLLSHPIMGNSWEGMVIEEILRGLNSRGISHSSFYYRTSAGAEVDLILEGKFGTIPIEIKYHQNTTLKKLIAIRNLIKERNLPFGLVIDNGERVRQLEERLFAVPFSCLG